MDENFKEITMKAPAKVNVYLGVTAKRGRIPQYRLCYADGGAGGHGKSGCGYESRNAKRDGALPRIFRA